MINSVKIVRNLREMQISLVLSNPDFKALFRGIIGEIKREALSAINEASVENAFELKLYALLSQFNIPFNPQKEFPIDTVRHIRKGRIDSKIGAVIIEYKHRSKLRDPHDVRDGYEQIKNYLESLSKNESSQYYGFLTDGINCAEFIFQDGKEIMQSETLLPFGVDEGLRLIRNITLLDKTKLSTDNLIKDFCTPGDMDNISYSMARNLYRILQTQPSNKTKMLRAEWEQLFRLGHDDRSQQKRIKERDEELSRLMNAKFDRNSSDDQYAALFSLQTTYSVIIKFIAYRIISDLNFGKAMKSYAAQLRAESETLRLFCSDLEEGDIFRDLGINNLLEGDFFSWYAGKTQWNDDIANSIREILKILSRYESTNDIFKTEKMTDLFKGLYEAIIPQVVRSSLGEFYTPQWLAEHVLRTVKPKSHSWRGLDPCAGSGTFVIAMIDHVLQEISDKSPSEQLDQVLNRVQAIDLNPLAVLTSRINYFIRISNLLPQGKRVNLQIPVYLGDSANVPKIEEISGVKCLTYAIATVEQSISVVLPISLAENLQEFSHTMVEYEKQIKKQNKDKAMNVLLNKLNQSDKKDLVVSELERLTESLIDLERKEWNGIWARIITNFLSTAVIGKFDIIIGNPPWIDWKNLPSGYRDRIKSICVDRKLFSGDGLTGGINLNVCALITSVSVDNWLSQNGFLAFLMPKSIAFQQSYDGFRQFRFGRFRRTFLEFDDWSEAGDPFYPIQHKFMTYVIGNQGIAGELGHIKVKKYFINKGQKLAGNPHIQYEEAMTMLEEKELYAAQIMPHNTAFTISESISDLDLFKKFAGLSDYIGREGIEFYPQELLLLNEAKTPPVEPSEGCVFVENIQVTGSNYKIPKNTFELETKFLFPLLKGASIRKFGAEITGELVVPFPYLKEDFKRPLSKDELGEQSPKLLDYYLKHKKILEDQTEFSNRIRGPNSGEFYGLARVGKYTFAKYHVAFRDNTKWGATVISTARTFWGESKTILCQNHATTICERSESKQKNKTRFITEDEAHFICAILNAPIVEKFILQSSDERSFKVRPPIKIPLYDPTDPIHKKLVNLSKVVHEHKEEVQNVLAQLDELYLSSVEKADLVQRKLE